MRHTRAYANVAALAERSTREAQLRAAGEMSEIASLRAPSVPVIRTQETTPTNVQRLSEAARLTSRRAGGQWWAVAPEALDKSISRALASAQTKQLRRDIEHVAELRHPPERGYAVSAADRYLESMPDGRGVAVHLASQFMARYAAISSILEEVRRRLGAPIRKVTDYGCGAGAGLWAALDTFDIVHYVGEARSAPLMRAGIAALNVEDLRQRLKQIHLVFRLSSDKPVPLQRGAQQDPGVPDEETLALSAYALSGMTADSMRERHIERIWRSRAQVIVLVEEATPRGFASIAAARAQLLQYGRDTGHDVHVLAPCPHDKPCPMLHPYGMEKSSRTPKMCAFKQPYHAPRYQRVAENTPRTERMSRYTYAVLARGPRPSLEQRALELAEAGDADAPTHIHDALLRAKGGILENLRAVPPEAEVLAAEQDAYVADAEPETAETLEPVTAHEPFPSYEAARLDSYQWPRLINTPLKKGGHVTIDACCPSGDLRRFTIAKSKGRQAYQDARKLRGSELYAHSSVSSRPSTIAPAAVTDRNAHAAHKPMPTEVDSGDLDAFFAQYGAQLESEQHTPTLDPKRIDRVSEAEHMYIGPEALEQAAIPGERNTMRRTRRGPKKRAPEISERGMRASRKLSRSALDAEIQDQW